MIFAEDAAPAVIEWILDKQNCKSSSVFVQPAVWAPKIFISHQDKEASIHI